MKTTWLLHIQNVAVDMTFWLSTWIVVMCHSAISIWTRSFISIRHNIQRVRVSAEQTRRYVKTSTSKKVFIYGLLRFDWGQYGNNCCNRLCLWLDGLISSNGIWKRNTCYCKRQYFILFLIPMKKNKNKHMTWYFKVLQLIWFESIEEMKVLRLFIK